MSARSDGLLKLFMFLAEPPFQLANFSQVNIRVLTLRTWPAMTTWAINDVGDKLVGVGYCAAEQGNGDKSQCSGADMRVYLYRPSSHVRSRFCFSSEA